jgi:CRISPR-associated endonuclease/helicase Cas3
MKGPAKGFWAKLIRNEAAEVVSWQPLEAHGADVAAVAEALLRHTILGLRLARLLKQKTLSDVQIARLSILAALHDVGKVNQGFQDRAYSKNARCVGHTSFLINFPDNPVPKRSRNALLEGISIFSFAWECEEL